RSAHGPTAAVSALSEPSSLPAGCLFFLATRRPPSSTLFPYTPLFRSPWGSGPHALAKSRTPPVRASTGTRPPWAGPAGRVPVERSEEHTSELQSRENLVCRLLLEKNKIQMRRRQTHPTRMITISTASV